MKKVISIFWVLVVVLTFGICVSPISAEATKVVSSDTSGKPPKAINWHRLMFTFEEGASQEQFESDIAVISDSVETKLASKNNSGKIYEVDADIYFWGVATGVGAVSIDYNYENPHLKDEILKLYIQEMENLSYIIDVDYDLLITPL